MCVQISTYGKDKGFNQLIMISDLEMTEQTVIAKCLRGCEGCQLCWCVFLFLFFVHNFFMRAKFENLILTDFASICLLSVSDVSFP